MLWQTMIIFVIIYIYLYYAKSNKVLKRMNRTYSREYFINLVKRIREILPKVGLSTDIIVGFPGETEQDFNETISLMKEVKFDSAFNFKYSSRPGTKASEYEDKVDEKTKQDRLQKVIQLQKKHTLELNQELVGSNLEVLLKKSLNYHPINGLAEQTQINGLFFNKSNSKINEIVRVKIERAKGVTLHGKILKNMEAA